VASAACPVNGKCQDSAAVDALSTRIATECGCTEVGRKIYMKCVKGMIKAAMSDGSLPRSCKKSVKKCESKSTCGRTGAVVCCEANGKGQVKGKVAKNASKCGGNVCNGARHALGACASQGACLSRPFKVVQQVFSQSCALPSCHSTLSREGELALDSEEVSYTNLVDRPAVHLDAPGMMRVKSGDASGSFLVQKLRGTAPGDRMPVGASLPEETIEIIEAWITRGAHSTAEECPAATIGDATTAAHGTGDHLTICDDAPISGGDFVWQPEPPLEAPDPSEGFQLYVPRKDVAPGTEWEYCYAFRVPWTEVAANIGVPVGGLGIRQQIYRMHQGSHHLLVYSYSGDHPDEWKLNEWFPCSAANCEVSNPEDCPPDAGSNLLAIGGTQVAGTRYEVTYPEGVFLPPTILSRDTVIIANLHYTNPFLPAQPIYGEAWLNFNFYGPGENRVVLDGMFALNVRDLIVEPYESKTMSEIWHPHSFLLEGILNLDFVPVDAAVFNMFGHMHKRGTLFQVDFLKDGKCSDSPRVCGRDDDCACKPWYKTIPQEDWQRNCVENQTCIRGPEAEDTTIYHTQSWDHAPVVDFPSPYLYVKKDTEALRWTCTIENGRRDDPAFPPKVCHEGCESCGWRSDTQECVFTRGIPLGVDTAPRTFQKGEPMPLVFGELADDNMCNLFGYFIRGTDLPSVLQ
jgi:hypothetical protein